MTDGTELPDDCNLWPRDPYRLFGVDRKSTQVEVRRAYFRLIRRFKPDDFPEQFQRIRSAYESLTHFQQYYSESSEVDESTVVPTENKPGDSFVADHFPIAAPDTGNVEPTVEHAAVAKAAPIAPPPDELAVVWDAVSKSKFEEAHLLAERLLENQPGNSKLLLIAYFLARAFPNRGQASSIDNRLGHLTKLLDNVRFQSIALSCLENEFALHPKNAQSPVVDDWLQANKDPELCERVALERWMALGPDAWPIILADAERLERFALEDGHFWARILESGLEYTIWESAAECRGFEAKALRELGVVRNHRDSFSLDQLDWLMSIAKAWQSTRFNTTHSLLRLLPFCRTLHPLQLRMRFGPVIESVLDNPKTALANLDKMATSNAPFVAILLQGLNRIDILDDCRDFTGDITDLHGLICDFLTRNSNVAYPEIRFRLSNFCLDFGIDLDLFAGAADEHRRFTLASESRSWVETIYRDLSLRAFHRLCSAKC